MVKSAIILAGGKGERLRPLTLDRPKPMVLLGGKPIVSYQIRQMARAGIEEIIFACSYKHEALQKEIQTGKRYKICAKYSVEEEPLGRGGGIKKAMGELTKKWDEVLVTNGDNLWRIDINNLVAAHRRNRAIATIVVVPLKSPYGIVEYDKHNHILGFREKPVLPHWINAGVYVFNREIEKLLPDIGDHETETFPKLPKENFFVYQSTDYWRGIDTVKDLSEAQKEIAALFP